VVSNKYQIKNKNLENIKNIIILKIDEKRRNIIANQIEEFYSPNKLKQNLLIGYITKSPAIYTLDAKILGKKQKK
jgi:hypothetical protein